MSKENLNTGNEPEQKQQGEMPTNVSAETPSQPDDLLKRVTQFVEEQRPEGKQPEEIDTEIYNDPEFLKKIEALEDPELKNYMTALRKSGVRGVSTKMSEIAEMRKELESLKNNIGSSKAKFQYNSIEEMINDPRFVQEASKYASVDQSSDDEYVPDSVKQKLKELDEIKNQLGSFQQQQTQAQLRAEHEALKNKYGNYQPQKIDEIRADLLNGKVNATSEHLYKAWYHDENVKRAYEMGKRDAINGSSIKAESMSLDGTTHKPNTRIMPEKEESDKNFLKRIIAKNLKG